MKKIGYIFAIIMLAITTTHAATTCKKTTDGVVCATTRGVVTKNMLEQIANINSFWRPIVGDSVYFVKKAALTVVVVRLYDYNKQDNDPENTDVQAGFICKGKACVLSFITFSPIDVTKYIDLLVE